MRREGEHSAMFSVQGFLMTRQILHEALSLESIAPLGETKYGGYEALFASCYEGYVYEVEADVVPTTGSVDVLVRCNAFPFANKDDASRFLEALGKEGAKIPTAVLATIECAWGFRPCEGYYFPLLRFSIKHADTLSQFELIEVLQHARNRFDDAFPTFELACQGGIAIPIAIERLRLALGASIEQVAH